MTAIVVLALRIGLAVLLYVFLWRVTQTLWQEIKGQSAFILSQKAPGIHVSVRPESGAEINYHFRQSEIIIGRSSNCDISLKDEALSARHARLSFHHGQWWLEDLGSTNGTFLNQDRIKVPAVVITGDQFKCGGAFFSLRIDPIPTNIQTKQTGELQ
ncbi:MAG: FHA domain-containing protein [Anaerolineales bacterium]